MASPVQMFLAQRALEKSPAQMSEVNRICSIPIATHLDDEEIDYLQPLMIKPEAYASGFRLTKEQVRAIHSFSQGRLVSPLRVGAGKTLISLRCAAIGLETGLQRVALFVPPQVHTQLVQRDIGWVRARVPLGCTFYPLGGLSAERRRALAGGRRGCWIIPYSLLSTQDTSEILERIRPELLILDEAHTLKNRYAARTRRILTYCRNHRPKVVVLSGTFTAKSIKDYAHLLSISLEEGSPVPVDAELVLQWSSVLDSQQGPSEVWIPRSSKTTGSPLRPLVLWANETMPGPQKDFSIQGFRWAYRDRLLSTPHIIASGDDELAVSLLIQNEKVESPSSRLKELQDNLDNLWETPSGDQIEFAMLKWKWAYELSAGVYNELYWPSSESVANARQISARDADDLIGRSKGHYILQQAYHKELRSFLNSAHRPGLDTPFLVGSNMHRRGAADVGKSLYDSWQAMRDADFPGRVERLSRPVRVCDYKIKAALAKMKKGNGLGIFWYYHKTFGDWLYEEAKKAGYPVLHCPAGDASNKLLSGAEAEKLCKGHYIIASMSAHGTGKNLQFLVDQYFVQQPRNEQMFEQAIGRTHRQGQKEDVVSIQTWISNEHDEMMLAACLNDAIYVWETTRQSRKVLIATWDPMPTVYGTHQLNRAGLQSKILTATQQELLTDRFGAVR